MTEHEATTEPASDESFEHADGVRARVWTITANDTDCDHPPATVRRVGDDGVNVYYQCTRCESVFVSREEIARLARPSGE